MDGEDRVMFLQAFRTATILAVAVIATILASSAVQAAVTFDWATIGDPNNAADTLVMNKGPCTNGASISCTGDGSTGYGSVGYTYRIAKHHVTMSQYTEFLNTVDPTGSNSLELYDDRMEQRVHPVSFLPIPAETGGIDFDPNASQGAKYTTKSGQENYPATWVSWVSAARFVNWLSNGQGAGDTESGVYNSLPTTASDPVPSRDPGAQFFLPSDDEFYKAAYYNPTLNGGTGGYTEYGTGNSPPTIGDPNSTPGGANYAQTDGVDGHSGDTYWQNNFSSYNSNLDHLTEVGAYSNATSHYGLFDVDGTAYQWMETTRQNQFGSQDLPIYRGGSWWHASDGNGAAFRNTQFFATGSSSLSSNYHSFRIASLVPALAGDFDMDGDVDGLDFLDWQINNRTQSELMDWEANYGMTLQTAAVSAVPEPTGLVLLATSFAMLCLSRRQRCA